MAADFMFDLYDCHGNGNARRAGKPKEGLVLVNNQRFRTRLLPIALCVAAISVLAILLWPIRCGDWLRQHPGDLTFYVVTPTFSSEGSIPELNSEQWTIRENSDEYAQILEIMDSCRCRRKISGISKNNRAAWLTVYDENGTLVLEYRGTNDIRFGNTNYTFYATNDSGKNKMNVIYSILRNAGMRNLAFRHCALLAFGGLPVRRVGDIQEPGPLWGAERNLAALGDQDGLPRKRSGGAG